MADTTAVTNNFVVEMKNSDVEGGNSGTEERKSNSESDWQESEWIRKIRLGLKARSGENAGGDVTIKKVPARLREPVERYTPQQWQFGLHNLQASSSESEVLKISLAAVFELKPDEWDKFCADFVVNPADVKKSYGIYSGTEPSLKEVQYRLTLDALALFMILNVISGFDRSLIDRFNIDAWLKRGVDVGIYDDLLLCENQIPLALMKKAISKCHGLLPEERKSNEFPVLNDPDSDRTKKLLDRILKFNLCLMCYRIFAEPCPDKKYSLFELLVFNYKVGELENCAHLFACFHKVITSCVREPPKVVTTTFGRAKQLFLRAVGTSSKQLASVIVTIFGFSRETATGEDWAIFQAIHSATDLKKAGLKIRGIPGMVQQVAFKNGCLFLPIIKQGENIASDICNMLAYEGFNTSPPFPFVDYIQLMSQLIQTPEDVSYLIHCDVIRPYRGTQKQILQVWQSLHIRYFGYSDEYDKKIVKPINRHCAIARNVMVTEFYNTFCSKPWLVISVISAIILLVATLIQTYVAVIGSDEMQPHYHRGG
jgi:hypothetical protein